MREILRLYRIRIAMAVLLSVLSALSLPGLRIDSDLSAALRSPDLAETGLSEATRDTLRARPVVLHVSSDTLASETGLQALSDLVLDLQLDDGVDQVLSVFSLTDTALQDSVLELALDQGQTIPQAFETVRSEAVSGPRFLAADLRSTIVVVQGAARGLDHIPKRYVACNTGDVLCVRAMGPIAIEQAIEKQLQSDNLILIPLTSLFCLGLLALWFRSLPVAALLMMPPGLGVIWYFGAMAALGVPLDAFNALVPTVILTLGLADMLHLYRAAQQGGGRRLGASALRAVLPAISVTTATTALAFATLALEGSPGLSRLALCGASGVVILWLAVVICGPMICHLRLAAAHRPRLRRRTAWLLCLTRRLRRRRRLVLGVAVGGVLFGVWLMISTPPDFTFEENLPRGPVAEAYDNAVRDQLALGTVFIALSERPPEEMQRTIALLYPDLRLSTDQITRAIADQGAVLLPLIVPAGMRGTEIIQLVEDRLGQLPASAGASALGFPLLASETILTAISRLTIILIIGVAVQAAILGVLLRSARIGLATVVPNLLPLLAIQIAMVLGTGWMNMSAAVAMIVASGIVVDDTAHLLWASRRRGGGISLAMGLRRVAEPVTLTSMVLGLGFAISMLSGLPGIGIFGALMALAMCVAWAADMVVLPTLLAGKRRRRG